jgi:hypothetical protein
VVRGDRRHLRLVRSTCNVASMLSNKTTSRRFLA